MYNPFTNIIKTFKNKSAKGYSRVAIKNSVYLFFSNVLAKGGSLLFTIIWARLLMPELFGLYSLALSTIVLFTVFSELGLQITLVKYTSYYLEKNNLVKAKSYYFFLFKVSIIVALIVSIILFFSSDFIANTYYQKPISLVLMAGALYLLFTIIMNFIIAVFEASNNFKILIFKEGFFQVIRMMFIPLIVIISLNYAFSDQFILFLIIIFSSLSFILISIVLFIYAKRTLPFLKAKLKNLEKKEKKELIKYTLPLSATVFSGVFLGYIDIIMLGRFVSSEFIGYYRIAFTLIISLASLMIFSRVLFPIFSRITEKRLEKGLSKSVKITFLFSLLGIIFVLIFAPLIVKIAFGAQYSQSINLLRLFSLLLITFPLTSLYDSYFYSRGKTLFVAKLLISSTILNILLNYFAITYFLSYGEFAALMGVAIATIISRCIYLFSLMYFKKTTISKTKS